MRAIVDLEVKMADQVTYTTYEAARLLGIDESNVRRGCYRGRFPGAFRETVRSRMIWRIPAAAITALQQPRREG